MDTIHPLPPQESISNNEKTHKTVNFHFFLSFLEIFDLP